jgi:hypothetical protein
MSTPGPASRLRTLYRRREWLKDRLTGDLTPGAHRAAAEELEAFEWMLPIVEQVVVNVNAEAYDVNRQRVENGWRVVAKRAARFMFSVDIEEWDRLVSGVPPQVERSLRGDVERCLARASGASPPWHRQMP